MANHSVFALTSLSPAASALARQRACLESWRRAGLEVRCFNHPDEIRVLASAYDADFIPVADTGIQVFGRHCVPVAALLSWAAAQDARVLIINADIELHLSPWELKRLVFLAEGGLCCFVRHNHDADCSETSQEPYGFDAFALHGRDAALFPPSFLSIGQPFWDYWLPQVFAAAGRVLYCVEFPAALHLAHPRGWCWEDWHRCAIEFDRLCPMLSGDTSLQACLDMSGRVRQAFETRKLSLTPRPVAIRAWVERCFGGSDPKIFLELGAHCGTDTAWMAALPNVTVHAFEPDPRNGLPPLPNVTIHRVAIAEQDGPIAFLLSDQGWGQEWTYSSSIKRPKHHLQRYPVTFGSTVEVPAVKLDTVYRQQGWDLIDLIWADIQGAEGEMIRGGLHALAHTRYLYTEYSDDELYEGQIDLCGILRLLPDFRVIELWPEDVLLENRMLAAVPARSVSELLAGLLGPGRLVFDIGAHLGAKCDRFLTYGARVVCVEPQPQSVRAMQLRYEGDARVTLLECAVGAADGRAVLDICSRAPYLSTLSEQWKQGRFRNEVWDRRIEIDVTTLDAMIARFGIPAFCKIDVEGYEQFVLAGLSTAPMALSIEFAKETHRDTRVCLERLHDLGYARFNLAFGEGDSFHFQGWVSRDAILRAILDSPDALAWGDVYAVPGSVA